MRRPAAALLVLLSLAPALRAEEAAPGDGLAAAVERCLKDLGSDDYETREAARQRLQGLSREARPLLEARRNDPDPEIRRTVEAILADLGETATAAPPGELGPLGLVTFQGEGTFTELAESWEREVGGRLKPAGSSPLGTAVDAKMQVDVRARPYFEALAALLRPAKLDLVDGFDEAGQALLVAHEASSEVPTAFVGPFRFEVDSVTTTRSLRSGVRPRHALLLRLAWAPGVQVASYTTPEVANAVDERGGSFAGADGRGSTYGIGGGRRAAMLQMTVEPARDPEGERIASLEATMRIRLRDARQQVSFEDLEGDAPWPRKVEADAGPGKGRARVVLESFGPDPDRRGWLMGVLTATLPKGVKTEGVSGALATSDGNVRPMLELSSRVASSDGVLRLTLRAGNLLPGVRATALRVAWYAEEREVLVPFVLKDIPLR